VLGWKFRSLWFDIVTLAFHWIDYVFFLMIVEGMSFTVRKQTKFRYCVTAMGERLHSAECNAIYATLAFAGIDLLFAFLSAIGVTLVIQYYCWKRYIYRDKNIVGASSPGKPANESVNEANFRPG
jgi:hypothetical protein